MAERHKGCPSRHPRLRLDPERRLETPPGQAVKNSIILGVERLSAAVRLTVSHVQPPDDRRRSRVFRHSEMFNEGQRNAVAGFQLS